MVVKKTLTLCLTYFYQKLGVKFYQYPRRDFVRRGGNIKQNVCEECVEIMAKRPILVTLSAITVILVLACFFVLHNITHVEESSRQESNLREARISVDLSRYEEEIAKAGAISDSYNIYNAR